MDYWPNRAYHERVMALGERIGKVAKERLQQDCCIQADVAKYFCKEFGLKRNSAVGFVSHVCTGYWANLYGTPANFRRLSAFLYIIGVEEDHPIIPDIRETHNDHQIFVYPPENAAKIDSA